MSAHADLGPSKAKQWLTCTPSVRLEKQFPNIESEYAAEGSLAHSLGELYVKIALGRGTPVERITALHEIESHILYKPEMKRFMGEYRDYVMEQYSAALKQDPKALIFIERKLQLDHLVPGSFGTGDIIIVWTGHVHLIDYKHGKGVLVEAEENPQLKLYACGALREFAAQYKIEHVYVTIYQPRLQNIDKWQTTSRELMAWAHDTVIPAAKKAWEGAGEFVAGDHCKFCNAKPACRKIAEYNLEIAQDEFGDIEILTAEEISNILIKASIFTSWIEAVKTYALKEAAAGRKSWPGLKLVAGKSRREYNNPEGLAKVLLDDMMFTEEEIYKKKELIGITEMQALVGLNNIEAHLKEFVIKNPGGPTFAPVNDKRPVFSFTSSADNDFKDF